MLKTKLLGATAAAELLAIEDVFSTYLYTGTGAAQTITNGIDLAGEGGLVWIKSRSATTAHFLFDTVRGTTKEINSNAMDAEASLANSVTAFNADGFSIGSANGIGVNAATYASWTFRKAPRFFDVVTYAGDAQASKVINHNLGSIPGFIIVKAISGASGTSNWYCYHRGIGNTKAVALNLTDAESTAIQYWRNTNPTSTQFTVGSVLNDYNTNFVAYLFAHDPLGPSGDGSDGLIACGLHTQAVTGANELINLGWEPQWVLTKTANSSNDWILVDNMRGFLATANSTMLRPNLANSDGLTSSPRLASNGFVFNTTAGQQHIYIAIRRGPMREPTSGTEVYLSSIASGVISTGFPVDFHMRAVRASADITNHNVRDRLRGGDKQLVTSGTTAETTDTNLLFDSNNGLRFSFPSGQIQHFFRRAPGFLDVVAYTGTGVNRTVSHNLGVIPELMIVKQRSLTGNWGVYSSTLGATKYLYINTADGENTTTPIWNNTAPTESVFTVGTSVVVNQASSTYIAYLFATLPGISKVGSYTGNGSSQTINCGFTGGARFILIKRTDTTGDWHLFDSARGIVSGNDPYHRPNTDFAEVTNNDSIDPDSSGFIVNQVSATDLNVSSASYIYLAIA
jgi:hypothetical protein